MISVIIAAAGSGSRMGGGVKKQYRKIENLTVLERTVKAFCAFKEIVVLVPEGDEEYVAKLLPGAKVFAGGASRQESVSIGLENVSGEYVLIHDAARCFIDEGTINRVCEALNSCDAVVPCVQPKSTIRTAEKTLNRSELYEVQTPQGFKTSVLREAHALAIKDGFTGTDDAGVAEHAGVKLAIVEGDYANIKITTEEDMPETIRMGTGYDVHKLVEGRKLMLGCTHVPYEKGLLGHSDADVCVHAIADAMLGAAALRDIGYHFPDNSASTEGMPGRVLLEKTMNLIAEAGYSVVNIDATIVAQVPKLSPHIEEMRRNTAEALNIDIDQVSIKATTEEGLGITGKGEAMACHAIAVLKG